MAMGMPWMNEEAFQPSMREENNVFKIAEGFAESTPRARTP